MIMIRIFSLLLVLIALPAFSACQTTDNPDAPPRPRATATQPTPMENVTNPLNQPNFNSGGSTR